VRDLMRLDEAMLRLQLHYFDLVGDALTTQAVGPHGKRDLIKLICILKSHSV